jgi:hypothetical protein
MARLALTENRPFAPWYGWTRADYERAVALREAPAVSRALETVVSKTPCTPTTAPRGSDSSAFESVASLLAAIGPKLSWQRDALCLEYPHVDFFDERHLLTARAVCARCAVRDECLADAVRNHERGLWAGTTDRERAKLRRATAA